LQKEEDLLVEVLLALEQKCIREKKRDEQERDQQERNRELLNQ